MKISEKMLEDWICENPEAIFGMVLLGRQVRLPHGVLDVLAYRPDIRMTSCIELKGRPLKEKDIGQVLRYTNDISHLINMAWYRMQDRDQFTLTDWDHSIVDRLLSDEPKRYRDDIFERLFFDEWNGYCSPTLIGSDIDDNTFAAARGARIVVLLWSYENEEFKFDVPDNKLNDGEYFPEWVQKILRLHIDYTAKEAIRIVDEDISPTMVGI